MRYLWLFSMVAVVLLIGVSAQAAIVADWDFDHLGGPNTDGTGGTALTTAYPRSEGDMCPNGSPFEDASGNRHHGFYSGGTNPRGLVTYLTPSGTTGLKFNPANGLGVIMRRGRNDINAGWRANFVWGSGNTPDLPYMAPGVSWTFEHMINFDNVSADAATMPTQRIFGENEGFAAPNVMYAFYAQHGDPSQTGIRVQLVTEGGSVSTIDAVFNTTAVDDTNWHHLAVVFDRTANTVSVYLDLAQLTSINGISGTGLLDISSISSQNIGQATANGMEIWGFLGGIIDRIVISDEVKAPGSFIIQQALPSPSNGAAEIDPAGLTLSWISPAISGSYKYDVYIDPNEAKVAAGDAGCAYVSSNQTGTAYTPSPELAYGTPYYWRVDVKDESTEALIAIGSVWTLTTGGGITNPSPADGAQKQGYATVLLDWDSIIQPPIFDVYISDNPSDLGTPVNTTETELEVAVDPNTVYYWAVDTKTAGGSVIVAGETLSFSTGVIVGHWKLDETSGTVAADSSGNGYDGFCDPNWTTGAIRGGLICSDLDGEGQDMLLIKTDYGTVNQASYSMWFMRDDDVLGDQFLIGNRGAQIFWVFHDPGQNRLRIYTGGDNWHTGVYTSLNEWHHLVATADVPSGSVRLYVDGELAGSRQMTMSPITFVDATMDHDIWSGFDNLRGKIDDVRVFEAVLTPQEVADLYAQGARASNPDPLDTEDRVLLDKVCAWDPGFDITGQTFQISTVSDFSTLVDSATLAAGVSSYDPLGATNLTLETPYYWRILSEQDSGAWTVTGPTWTFTTIGPVATDPDPANGATGVAQNKILGWLPGADYDSGSGDHHEVYLAAGTVEGDLPVIPTATVTGEAYDPSGVNELAFNTAYVWRVDEYINGTTYTGDVWTFTTGDAICDPVLLADINGDCVVNLTDFAQLAAEWLDCTLTNGDCP